MPSEEPLLLKDALELAEPLELDSSEVGGKEDEGDSLGEVDDWLVTGEQAKNNEDKRNNGAIFLMLILSVASELPSYCMGANCKEKEAIDC